MTPRWRIEARRLIAEAVAGALEEQPSLRRDLGVLFLNVATRAYPHASRKGQKWAVWLKEIQRARRELEAPR